MIELGLEKIEMGVWMPLLGRGIGIAVKSGNPLREFLCNQLNIAPEYLENRIQTLLINGQAVDDVGCVEVVGGDVIALSAAMPGLAGATLRRGSYLSAMRSEITQKGGTVPSGGDRPGMVILKLFNMVATEIGPQILSGEFLLTPEDLRDLDARYPHLKLQTRDLSGNDWIEVTIHLKG